MKKFEILKYNTVKEKNVSDNKTSFAIQPLERGFGHTLGNAVRRTLLSSVYGVAPFAVKINGVQHEFETIDGIHEDVVQLILNLKQVTFTFNEEIFSENEVMKVTLKNTDKKITAAQFQTPFGMEVVNKDQYIATANKINNLELELYVTAGRGFLTFEENKNILKEKSSLIESSIKNGAFIAIDSDFSPIHNVAYSVKELNSSAAEIQAELTLEVETNGSISAKEAVSKAANILIAHLSILGDMDNLDKYPVFKDFEEEKEEEVEDISISSLDLSVRSYNCLKRAGYLSLNQLRDITVDELKSINHLGKKSVEEIISKLAEHNIHVEGAE